MSDEDRFGTHMMSWVLYKLELIDEALYDDIWFGVYCL